MRSVAGKTLFAVPFFSVATMSFAAGIWCAFKLKLPWWSVFLLCLCVFLSLFLARKKAACLDGLILLVFFLVGFLRQSTNSLVAADDISFFNSSLKRPVIIHGIMVSHLQETPYEKTFILRPSLIQCGREKYAVSGKLFVRCSRRVNLKYGDQLKIKGTLTALKDKGYFNRRLLRQGIRSVVFVRRGGWVYKVRSGKPSIQRLAFEIKEKLKSRFSMIAAPTGDFMTAFILGDRKGLPQELYCAFQYTGTVHIIAISGLNIGIIIFILLVVLKMLRLRRGARFIVTLVFLVFYSFVTGLQASVVRAVIMGAVFLLSYLVGREYHVYNSLALAAMIILFAWPWQIYDIGFQLSFISVLSIVIFYPKVAERLPKPPNRIVLFFLASFLVSLSATIGVGILVAYYFGIVSTVSLFANVVVVMFMPPIIAGGFMYLILSFCAPLLAGWVACSLECIINCLLWVTVFFKDLPCSYFFVEPFSIYAVIVYYVVLLFFLNRPRLRFRRRNIEAE